MMSQEAEKKTTCPECAWEKLYPLLVDAGEEADGVPFLPCVRDMERIHGWKLKPADLAGVV